MADEPHVATWAEYAKSPWPSLRRLPQTAFPIRAGISQSENYLAATRRGESVGRMAESTCLALEHTHDLQIRIHPTAAGRVPILIPKGRADFVACVRAFAGRNEPIDVPESQGATTVYGYNNWDRVRRHREAWAAENPHGDWDDEFQSLIPRKALYQDTFIILSDGPYSAVAASDVGLSEDAWREASLTIRMAHEATHYFTKRVFGVSRNNVLDEVLCDYAGIVAALGRFRADWLLLFLGLDRHPDYREGGRIQNYCKELSPDAFRELRAIVHAAAGQIERYDASRPDPTQALLTLAGLSLEEMAAEGLTASAPR